MKQGEGVNKEKRLTNNVLQTEITQSDSNLCCNNRSPRGVGHRGGGEMGEYVSQLQLLTELPIQKTKLRADLSLCPIST